MPRKTKPARLFQRKDDGAWIILDRGTQVRTGFGHGQECEAEEALAEYIRHSRSRRTGPTPSDGITIGEIIENYVRDHGKDVADPERMRYAIKALMPFWAERTPKDVSRQSTLAYQNARRGVAPATVRRELVVLRAALNWAHNDGILVEEIKVALPSGGKPKDRWLTPEEVTRLVEVSPPHLQRFILIAVNTGRRKDAILRLRWNRWGRGGHIDLEGNRINFLGDDEVETNKRRGQVPIPQGLLSNLSQWKSDGYDNVITFRDQPVLDIKTSFKKAVQRAGLGNDVTPHTLKHTAVTWAAKSGVPIYEASHFFETSPETLQRVYQHHSPEHLRSVAEALDSVCPIFDHPGGTTKTGVHSIWSSASSNESEAG